MKIAIPTADGRLNLHFGHCKTFVILEMDTEKKSIIKKLEVPAPKHEPGVLPRFLAQQGVNVIISGGMGVAAQNLFKQAGIEVVLGAASQKPEELAVAYLEGTLQAGENICDH